TRWRPGTSTSTRSTRTSSCPLARPSPPTSTSSPSRKRDRRSDLGDRPPAERGAFCWGWPLIRAEIRLRTLRGAVQPTDVPPQPFLPGAQGGQDRHEVLAPVGPAAGGVGEAVLPRQLPRAGDVARAGEHLRVPGESGDGAPDEERRLG